MDFDKIKVNLPKKFVGLEKVTLTKDLITGKNMSVSGVRFLYKSERLIAFVDPDNSSGVSLNIKPDFFESKKRKSHRLIDSFFNEKSCSNFSEIVERVCLESNNAVFGNKAYPIKLKV